MEQRVLLRNRQEGVLAHQVASSHIRSYLGLKMVSDGRLGAPQTSASSLRLSQVLVRRQPLLQASSPWLGFCLLQAAKGDELISSTREVALTPPCQLLLELGSGRQAGYGAGTRPALHEADLLTHLPLLLNKPWELACRKQPQEPDG